MPGAAQDMVGHLGCQGTLQADTQLAVDQNTQIPFYGATLQPLQDVPNQDVVWYRL